MEVRSVYEFSGAARLSILRLKYQGEYARAEWHGRQLAELAVALAWTPDALIPVPLHRRKERRRGYNQSGLLARSAATTLEVPLRECLLRERDTPSQTSLDRQHRLSNVTGAFSCRDNLGGLSVVLIDDVTTTGATLLECARVCLDAGASEVKALTIATDV